MIADRIAKVFGLSVVVVSLTVTAALAGPRGGDRNWMPGGHSGYVIGKAIKAHGMVNTASSQAPKRSYHPPGQPVLNAINKHRKLTSSSRGSKRPYHPPGQ